MIIFGLLSVAVAVFGGIVGWFSFKNIFITLSASFGISLLLFACFFLLLRDVTSAR